MGPYAETTPLTRALVEDDPVRVRELTRDTNGSFVISRMTQLPLVKISCGDGAGGTPAAFFDGEATIAKANLLDAAIYGGAMEVARDLTARLAPGFIEPYFQLGDRLARYLTKPDTEVFANGEELSMLRTLLQGGAKMRTNQEQGGWKAVVSAKVTCEGATLNRFLLGLDVEGTTLPYAIAESGAFGSASALKQMLNEKALDVNERSPSGTTLLMHAVQVGNSRTVQMLLDAGADARIEVVSAGKLATHTALSIAKINNDDESVAAIEASSARGAINNVLATVRKGMRP